MIISTQVQIFIETRTIKKAVKEFYENKRILMWRVSFQLLLSKKDFMIII